MKAPILKAFFFAASTVFLPASLEAAEAEPPREPFRLKGSFSADYQFRTTEVSGDRVSDNDLYEKLRLDSIGSPAKGYEFHLLATARQDLDGDQNETGFFPFEDIGDTYDTSWRGYVYEGHIDLNNPLPHVTQLRFGRQAGAAEEPVFFDGLVADLTVTHNLNLTVYGGASVHHYELEYDWGSDTLGGARIEYFPFRRTKLSLDYLYVDDERDLILGTDQQNDLLSFKVHQRLGPSLRTMAGFRYLDDEPRDMKVRAIKSFLDAGMELSLTYFRQSREQNELSNELSPFYDVMGTSDPFESIDMKLRKFFGRRYTLDLGYFHRDLIKDREENAFNRQYERAFAMFGINDVFSERMSLAITGEYWETGDTEYTSGGLDAEYRLKRGQKSTKIIAGTYYSLYKYDYYILLGEREHVQTYYLKTKMPLGMGLTMNARYEYEDSIEDYHTLKVGVRYDF